MSRRKFIARKFAWAVKQAMAIVFQIIHYDARYKDTIAKIVISTTNVNTVHI